MAAPSALWPKVFAPLVCRAVERDCPDLLARVLSLARDAARLGPAPPDDNDPALMKACEADRYELVRVLVSHGYRLRSGHFPDDTGNGSGKGLRRTRCRRPSSIMRLVMM